MILGLFVGCTFIGWGICILLGTIMTWMAKSKE